MRWLPHCMRDKDAIRCFSAGATSYSKRLARQMLCYKRKVKNKTNTQQLENQFVVQTLTNDDCFDWNLAKRYMHSGIQHNHCHIPEQNPAATNCVWNTLCLSHQQTSTYRDWSHLHQATTNALFAHGERDTLLHAPKAIMFGIPMKSSWHLSLEEKIFLKLILVEVVIIQCISFCWYWRPDSNHKMVKSAQHTSSSTDDIHKRSLCKYTKENLRTSPLFRWIKSPLHRGHKIAQANNLQD